MNLTYPSNKLGKYKYTNPAGGMLCSNDNSILIATTVAPIDSPTDSFSGSSWGAPGTSIAVHKISRKSLKIMNTKLIKTDHPGFVAWHPHTANIGNKSIMMYTEGPVQSKNHALDKNNVFILQLE